MVDRTLSLIRLPAETVLRVVPKTRMTESAESALDRADAAVRGAAGAALGDSGLKNDARALRAKIESRAPSTTPTRRETEAPPAPAAKKRAPAAKKRAPAKSSRAKTKRTESSAQKRSRAKAKEHRAEAHEERQEALRAGEEPLGLKATVDRAKEERKRVDPDAGTSRGANGGAQDR